MKIYLGTDHRGVDIENQIKNYLEESNFEVISTTIAHNDLDDYPDFAFEVCHNVVKNPESIGILLCGTGIGMSIAANKVKGIRAAKCVSTDDAHFAKLHNAANVLCLGMNGSTFEDICSIIDTFISTKSADEEKHLRRVNKIINYENGAYNEL